MTKSILSEELFMNKMIESYASVHTKRYWTEIAPFIENVAGKKVLDIGCGPGLLLHDIYQKYGSNMLFALDLSLVMLEKAKTNLASVPSERVQFIAQHMQENYSLPENLDLILSSRVMRSFENQWDILSEIYRSLNKEGILVLLDWSKESIYSYEKYLNMERKHSPEEIIMLHRNFSRYDLLDWKYILENVGLTIVHAFQLNEVMNVIIGKKL